MNKMTHKEILEKIKKDTNILCLVYEEGHSMNEEEIFNAVEKSIGQKVNRKDQLLLKRLNLFFDLESYVA